MCAVKALPGIRDRKYPVPQVLTSSPSLLTVGRKRRDAGVNDDPPPAPMHTLDEERR